MLTTPLPGKKAYSSQGLPTPPTFSEAPYPRQPECLVLSVHGEPRGLGTWTPSPPYLVVLTPRQAPTQLALDLSRPGMSRSATPSQYPRFLF